MQMANTPDNIIFLPDLCEDCHGLGSKPDGSRPHPRSKACSSCYSTGHAWKLDTSKPSVNRFTPQVSVSNENLDALRNEIAQDVIAQVSVSISSLKDEMRGILSAVLAEVKEEKKEKLHTEDEKPHVEKKHEEKKK